MSPPCRLVFFFSLSSSRPPSVFTSQRGIDSSQGIKTAFIEHLGREGTTSVMLKTETFRGYEEMCEMRERKITHTVTMTLWRRPNVDSWRKTTRRRKARSSQDDPRHRLWAVTFSNEAVLWGGQRQSRPRGILRVPNRQISPWDEKETLGSMLLFLGFMLCVNLRKKPSQCEGTTRHNQMDADATRTSFSISLWLERKMLGMWGYGVWWVKICFASSINKFLRLSQHHRYVPWDRSKRQRSQEKKKQHENHFEMRQS